MKQILIPISFSQASANSIQHANSLFDKSQLTLLHCYSRHSYNRKHDFGGKDYDAGIKELLMDFYKSNMEGNARKVKLITSVGNVSESIAEISGRFDLMVMSKKQYKGKNNGRFSEKELYIAAKGHCPVLLMPVTNNLFDLKESKNIWHIKRREVETAVLNKNLPKIGINPQAVEVKLLEQTTFKSSFWASVLSYTRTHKKAQLKEITESEKLEKIDLIILVSHEKDTFKRFMKSEVMRIINGYHIPLLVFQAE